MKRLSLFISVAFVAFGVFAAKATDFPVQTAYFTISTNILVGTTNQTGNPALVESATYHTFHVVNNTITTNTVLLQRSLNLTNWYTFSTVSNTVVSTNEVTAVGKWLGIRAQIVNITGTTCSVDNYYLGGQMKISIVILLFLVPVVMLAQIVKQTTDIYISNTDGQTKLKAIDPTMAAGSINWLEFGSQTNTLFSVSANGSVYSAGTITVNGSSVTNVAASNIVSGGQLALATVTTGLSAVAGPFITSNGVAHSYSYNAASLTNLPTTAIVGGITTNVLVFDGSKTNQLNFTNGVLKAYLPNQ